MIHIDQKTQNLNWIDEWVSKRTNPYKEVNPNWTGTSIYQTNNNQMEQDQSKIEGFAFGVIYQIFNELDFNKEQRDKYSLSFNIEFKTNSRYNFDLKIKYKLGFFNNKMIFFEDYIQIEVKKSIGGIFEYSEIQKQINDFIIHNINGLPSKSDRILNE